MIDGFKEREQSMEAKWAHDEDLRFRAITRRNKLLGLWAAEAIGLKGSAAESYANTLLDLEVRGAQDEDLVQKIHGDFADHSAPYSQHYIRRKMDELAAVATALIMSQA